MRIESATFVSSAGGLTECPTDPRVEIALSGRSNVGKSSLLNSLVGRRELAKVANTPGKTRRLNYFLVNDSFHVVDLPGYGYASASGAARNAWSEMMQGYLRKRRQLVGVIQLVDARHVPSSEDREMICWLRDERMSFCLAATKVDKLGPSKRAPALRVIARDLELVEAQPIVAYSSHTGEGRPALLAWIGHTLDALASS